MWKNIDDKGGIAKLALHWNPAKESVKAINICPHQPSRVGKDLVNLTRRAAGFDKLLEE